MIRYLVPDPCRFPSRNIRALPIYPRVCLCYNRGIERDSKTVFWETDREGRAPPEIAFALRWSLAQVRKGLPGRHRQPAPQSCRAPALCLAGLRSVWLVANGMHGENNGVI
jgi:hypothetical protein